MRMLFASMPNQDGAVVTVEGFWRRKRISLIDNELVNNLGKAPMLNYGALGSREISKIAHRALSPTASSPLADCVESRH